MYHLCVLYRIIFSQKLLKINPTDGDARNFLFADFVELLRQQPDIAAYKRIITVSMHCDRVVCVGCFCQSARSRRDLAATRLFSVDISRIKFCAGGLGEEV